MKKTILLIFFFFIVITFHSVFAHTETTKFSRLYIGLGGGAGYKGSIVGVTSGLMLSKGWGGSISYDCNFFKPPNLPSDYRPGFIIFESDRIPKNKIHIISLNVMREYESKKKWMIYGLEGGFSWIRFEQARFVLDTSSNIWFGNIGSNYYTTYKTTNTIGISARAKIEFLITKSIGLQLAAYTNINQFHSFIGGEIYFIYNVRRF